MSRRRKARSGIAPVDKWASRTSGRPTSAPRSRCRCYDGTVTHWVPMITQDLALIGIIERVRVSNDPDRPHFAPVCGCVDQITLLQPEPEPRCSTESDWMTVFEEQRGW